MGESEQSSRPLVNGALLGQFVGKSVTLFGTVIDTDKNGTSFDLKTSDKHIVTVALRKPLMEPIMGVVEVHGTAKGKSNIVCDYHMVFPEEISKSYDNELSNNVVTILHSIPNVWKDD